MADPAVTQAHHTDTDTPHNGIGVCLACVHYRGWPSGEGTAEWTAHRNRLQGGEIKAHVGVGEGGRRYLILCQIHNIRFCNWGSHRSRCRQNPLGTVGYGSA